MVYSCIHVIANQPFSSINSLMIELVRWESGLILHLSFFLLCDDCLTLGVVEAGACCRSRPPQSEHRRVIPHCCYVGAGWRETSAVFLSEDGDESYVTTKRGFTAREGHKNKRYVTSAPTQWVNCHATHPQITTTHLSSRDDSRYGSNMEPGASNTHAQIIRRCLCFDTDSDYLWLCLIVCLLSFQPMILLKSSSDRRIRETIRRRLN